MPSPTLAFAATLQDAKRLPQGLGFGDVLEELVRCIPFVRLEAPGESVEVARVIGAGQISILAGWRAAGATPTKQTPTDSSFSFNFRRIDTLSEDDPTVAMANRDPNAFALADLAARRVAIVRKIGVALAAGVDDDTTGFLGWENMTVVQGNRTDVTAGAATAAGVLESLLRIDDACTSGMLGNRATAFVTTALGRRNIERAAQATGLDLQYRMCTGLTSEVPYYRAKPIIVSSGLTDNGVSNTAPLYAVDFTNVYIVASTGHPHSFCVEGLALPLQNAGFIGRLMWFHGACVVRHGTALVRTTITTTLSA